MQFYSATAAEKELFRGTTTHSIAFVAKLFSLPLISHLNNLAYVVPRLASGENPKPHQLKVARKNALFFSLSLFSLGPASTHFLVWLIWLFILVSRNKPWMALRAQASILSVKLHPAFYSSNLVSSFFPGKHCTEVDHCADNPCFNGQCVSLRDSFRCHCDSGFRGPDCRIDINECLDDPCRNGRCVNNRGSYQ